MTTLSVKIEHQQILTIHILLMYSLPKVKKTYLKAAKEALLLKIHALEMANRKCSTLNAIQTVSKHVQAAVTFS